MENLELTIVLIDSTVESSVHVATPTIMGVSPPLEEPTTITDARVLPSVPVATTSSGITVAASEGESVVGGSVSVPITETLTTTTPHPLTEVGVSPATPLCAVSRVKLPELALKRFGGDVSKWSTFWDTFESTIDRSPALSEVEKFSYLQSLLESSAAEAISGLSLTSANYNEAICILKKRFGNSQLIISKHMDTLVSLDPVPPQGSTRQLRRFYDVVESQVRGLKALGVASESYGALLCNTLLKRLPPDIQLILSRGLPREGWDLDRLLVLLEAELLARERTVDGTTQGHRKPINKPQPPTAIALVAPTSVKCVYCSQSHPAASCPTVPSVEARKQTLRRTGRCYICLRQNHISRNCQSSHKCSKCHGRHHVSICSQTDSTKSEGRVETTVTGANTTPVLYVNNKTQVLLQTATMVLHDVYNPRKTVCARAVLDSGSQRSYVTTEIQERLSLPTASIEVVEISTFGSPSGSKGPCNVVNLSIITKDVQTVEISALVVPYICEAVYRQSPRKIADHFDHLSGLDLADDGRCGATSAVEILIGSDYYWSLVSGQVYRGTTGPIALDTRVGWILSGPTEGSKFEESVASTLMTHALRVDALSELEGLEVGLKRFWDLESIGVLRKEESVHSRFTQEIEFKDGRYTVSLPWRTNCHNLSDNYGLCVKRLQGLHKRLRQDPSLLKAYDKVIKEQLELGIVERVPESEALRRIHYLPHHPVVREDKVTSKVRIVYDASSFEGDSASLNQCLHIGPSFNQSILDILIRFRTHPVALSW